MTRVPSNLSPDWDGREPPGDRPENPADGGDRYHEALVEEEPMSDAKHSRVPHVIDDAPEPPRFAVWDGYLPVLTVAKRDERNISIHTEDGAMVASLLGPNPLAYAMAITKAVNAHGPLVEALTKVRDWLQQASSVEEPMSVKSVRRSLRTINEALAQLEPKPSAQTILQQVAGDIGVDPEVIEEDIQKS